VRDDELVRRAVRAGVPGDGGGGEPRASGVLGGETSRRKPAYGSGTAAGPGTGGT
jgi:hypothetical protein